MLDRIICGLSIAAMLYAQQATAPPRAVELLLGKARALESRGRIDLAAQTWKQLLMIEPDQQDAMAGLARAARMQGKTAEAEAYLSRLRKLNPANPAIKQIEAVGSPASPNPDLQTAGRLAAAGQNEKAIAAYRRAFGDNAPPAEWAVPYYETLASTPGGWEQATAGLEAALRRNPATQEYKLSLGRLYTYRPASRMKGLALLEQVSGALSSSAQLAWHQALDWESGSSRSSDSLKAYLSRYPDANLEAISKKQKPATAQPLAGGEELRKAYLALKNEDLTGAEKLFEEALSKNPQNSGALTGIGFIRMKQQNFGGALKNFEAAVSIGPETRVLRDAVKEARFWVTMQDAAAALKRNDSDEAVALFRKAVADRPDSSDALEGYEGALMQHGDYSTALPILERLVKANPTRPQRWKDLIIASQYTSGAQAALDMIGKIPPSVVAKLNTDIEYLAALTGIQQRAGNSAEARRSFAHAAALAEKTKNDLPVYLEIQLGSLYLNFGDATYAVNHYRAAIQIESTNLDAWEGFLLASNRARSSRAALKVLEALPPSVHEAALARPGFLRAVAALQARVGDLSSAESLLDRAQSIETADGRDPSFYTQLQIAQLWLEQGKAQQAAQRFSELSHSYPENEEVWKGLVLGLQKSGALDQASEVVRRVPSPIATVLGDDPDYVGAVAALYKETNSTEEAVTFLREATARFATEGRTVPPSLTVQLGWMLVDRPGSERDLFVLLRNARTRTDFQADQRKALDDIWTAWLTRSADAAATSGDTKRAISILEAGIRMLPSEVRLQRSLAATLLTSGDAKRATALYQAAGLRNATPTDYVAAVGAAAAAGENRVAQVWLKDGLTLFPIDADLLNLAGKQAAAKGDFKKAKTFWHLALQQADLKTQEKRADSLRSGSDGIRDLSLSDPADQAGAVVLSKASSEPSSASESAPFSYHLPWAVESRTGFRETAGRRTLATEGRNSESGLMTESLLAELLSSQSLKGSAQASDSQLLPVASTPTAALQLSSTSMAAASANEHPFDLKRSLEVDKPAAAVVPTGTPKANTSRVEDLLSASNASPAGLVEPIAPSIGPTSERDTIVDRIKAVENRNSPYVGLGGYVLNRTGQAGFERMMLQESTLESSTVIHGGIRASIIAKSVFADATRPDGLSLYRFGLLPQGDTFDAPSVNGLGAEAQLSGNNFGVRFGSTPRGFPVRNLVGGFRFRPAGGPITLTFDRDSVKDTILSYAGAQDPVSHRVWGGVMANSGTATGNFGDEKSGVYFNLGFQYITGDAVQTNNRVDGTVGTYWRLAHTAAGSLNAGVNLFAMHYAKNLRYFTLGQGGYFSPQRFLLFNVPVTWTGKAKRLDYVVGASIGSQSFTENASPYFPLDPLVQGVAGPYYPNLSSSGVNYNMDFRSAYQIADNWFLVGYINVNNARFYSQRSAGISIRYSFGARPLGADFSIPSIPDWRGRQPFGLP